MVDKTQIILLSNSIVSCDEILSYQSDFGDNFQACNLNNFYINTPYDKFIIINFQVDKNYINKLIEYENIIKIFLYTKNNIDSFKNSSKVILINDDDNLRQIVKDEKLQYLKNQYEAYFAEYNYWNN